MKKKSITKLIPAGFLASAALLLLASCGSFGANDGKTAVRIAYFPNITHSQALVMKAECTLEKAWTDNCVVSWTPFNAGPAETEAIFAGEIDIGYIGPVPALLANSKSGGEVKIIAGCTDYGAVLLTRKDAGIHSISDMRGKTVAVPQLGNTQHLCLLSLLSANGLKTRDKGGDVTVSASANADILNLIDNNRVDAALVPEPWGATIEKNGNAAVFLDYDQIMPAGSYPTAVVIVRQEFLEKHPDLVNDFLDFHKAACAYINEHTDEAIGIVNTEIQNATGKALENDVIARAFSRMNITPELNRESIMEFGRISQSEGFIQNVPEENDVFATEFNQ